MILDFTIMLGDHEVIVNVSKLESGKYWTTVRELNVDKKAILDIDATFDSYCCAMRFAKQYVQEFMNEL